MLALLLLSCSPAHHLRNVIYVYSMAMRISCRGDVVSAPLAIHYLSCLLICRSCATHQPITPRCLHRSCCLRTIHAHSWRRGLSIRHHQSFVYSFTHHSPASPNVSTKNPPAFHQQMHTVVCFLPVSFQSACCMLAPPARSYVRTCHPPCRVIRASPHMHPPHTLRISSQRLILA